MLVEAVMLSITCSGRLDAADPAASRAVERLPPL